MVDWLRDVCLGQTNRALEAKGRRRMCFGELLLYIGIRKQMASAGSVFTVNDFFSPKDFNERTNPCPYNFRKYMRKSRFKDITAELQFTDWMKPDFVDRFWEVRQMIAAWNKRMAEVFLAEWCICLDESMSIWHNRWTCPGWVYCPRKPHPFGNEYHSACCAITGVMFAIEIVEGKY